jgi:hypothetical protein
MKRAEILCALALLAVAGIGVAEAIRLGSGWGASGPRAGFFPFWLSVILGLSSLGILANAFRMNPDSPEAKRPFVSWKLFKPVLAVFVPMAGAILLFELLGFYVTAALYLTFTMRWMGRHPWPLVFAVSFLFPVATFFLLERWFLIPMPKGIFWH